MEQLSPGYRLAVDKAYHQAIQHVNRADLRRKVVSDTVYIVPVVFHVLYNKSVENIPDSLLFSQLEVLNQDFRRLNPDTGNLRSIFKSRAGDTRVEFRMASQDPNGNPSNGIDRQYTSVTSWGSLSLNDNMKKTANGGVAAWDPDKYLNIWVCNMDYSGSPYVLGYAYPPVGAPNWGSGSNALSKNYEGVVLHYLVTGRNNPYGAAHSSAAVRASVRGRTATHEVGHFMGLRHIWGDPRFTSDRCVVDDGIDDTPKASDKSNFDCNKSKNTCNEGAGDMPDLVENYMDYSSNICQVMFTRKQSAIMQYCLTQLRPGLAAMRVEFDTLPDPRKVYTVYPVPSSSGVVNISLPDDFAPNTSVLIFDAVGRLVQPEDQFGPVVTRTAVPGVWQARLGTGFYMIRIFDPKKNEEKFFRVLITGN